MSICSRIKGIPSAKSCQLTRNTVLSPPPRLLPPSLTHPPPTHPNYPPPLPFSEYTKEDHAPRQVTISPCFHQHPTASSYSRQHRLSPSRLLDRGLPQHSNHFLLLRSIPAHHLPTPPGPSCILPFTNPSRILPYPSPHSQYHLI